ncbi:hypothetical protein [Cyclobacterium sp.]|uniref:hypothetical protein n=1 Tax=Cyclobacterium sp. TaxID=1966343 RepID=UPI0025C5DF6B|nr:hypothetical protein [Cyclobacterium sp.]
MKNSRIYYISIIILSLISCNDIESDPSLENQFQGTYTQEIEQMKAFYNTGLDLAIEQLEISVPVKLQSNHDLEERLLMGILDGLNNEIFSLPSDGFNTYSFRMNELLNLTNRPNNRLKNILLSDANIFNESQIKMTEPFIQKLLTTENPTDAKSVANLFEREIIESSLNYGEKVSLLSLSFGAIVVSDFILNDGIEKIRDKIKDSIDNENQVAGCSVNMRNVWGDAVVGFAAGATAGCYAGATAGTVAFPVVGTVTGCVSAGMVSGAGGFISGASYSIISGLLLSCFR